LEPSRPAQRPYQIRRRSLHRQGRLVAYEFALADPQTREIYPASPRVRCRLSQQAECHRLFQAQAMAWAQGQMVPWSQYLPQA
jgi:predicted lipoprotein